jgi:hypothetical protein
MIFDRVQPGFSLTQEPKGTPFENPPDITDPEEAAMYHLDKMNNADAFEDISYFLEKGIDIPTLVQGILRNAVFQGIHSIDVSLIVAPTLHEFIKDIGDLTGVDYDEGISNDKERAVIRYQRNVARAEKMLKKLGVSAENTMSGEETEDGDGMKDQMEAMIVADAEEKPMEDTPMEEPTEAPMEEPKGLMSRSMM